MNFKITLSDVELNLKPTKKEIGKIKNSLNICVDTDMNRLKRIVLKYPFICCETNVKGRPVNNEDWISQQIFALDFDSGITPDEFLVKCGDILKPNIIYSSFSDTPEFRKFRAIWVLDDKITHKENYKFFINGLIDYFGADKKCSDLSRYYNPGKAILYYNDTPICEMLFTSFISTMVCARDGGDTRKYKKMLKNATPIYNNIGSGVFQQKSEEMKIIDEIVDYDFKKAVSLVKILDIFFNGNNRVSYQILFGIASNFRYIRGGLQSIKKRMIQINNLGGGRYFPYSDNRGIEKYPEDYFSILSIIKYNYLPMMLENFSPFIEDSDFHNLLDLRPFRKGRVDILEKKPKIKLRDAEIMLNNKLKETLNRIDRGDLFDLNPKIYIFKVDTGIGKTQLLENIENVSIALPNNRLKEEVYERMKIQCDITPDYPIFSDEKINEYLNNLHNCGLYKSATNIINKISLNDYDNINDDDIIKANYYINQNEVCRTTNNTIITSHTRLLNDTTIHKDILIFDECPLNQFIEIGSINLDFSMFDNTEYSNIMKEVEDFYRNKIGENYIDENHEFIVPNSLLEYCSQIKNGGNIIKLLNSDFIYKDGKEKGEIKFCKVNKFNLEKNIVIMSASTPIFIWEKLFPGRVEIIDISNIEKKGIIEQHTRRGYSSSAIEKYKKTSKINEIIKQLMDEINDTKKEDKDINIITHLKHKNLFKNNNCEFWFGNCSGGDNLKGKDIAIIGTPNKPQYVHFFYAKICGVSLKTNDCILTDKIIEYEGLRFRYFTYENEDLRNIQFALIQSDLIQAAGRARPLRENVQIKIFSNFPLGISDKYIY